jgi:hypothetical protein
MKPAHRHPLRYARGQLPRLWPTPFHSAMTSLMIPRPRWIVLRRHSLRDLLVRTLDVVCVAE